MVGTFSFPKQVREAGRGVFQSSFAPLASFPRMEKGLEENMERGQLRGTAVRGKGLKIGLWGNSSKSLPTTPGRVLERWTMPRALPGAVGGQGADVALLLSGSPRPASIPCGGGSLCDRGQEEVGEMVLQHGGDLNGGR